MIFKKYMVNITETHKNGKLNPQKRYKKYKNIHVRNVTENVTIILVSHTHNIRDENFKQVIVITTCQGPIGYAGKININNLFAHKVTLITARAN